MVTKKNIFSKSYMATLPIKMYYVCVKLFIILNSLYILLASFHFRNRKKEVEKKKNSSDICF